MLSNKSIHAATALRDCCVVMLQRAEQLAPAQVEYAASLAYECGCGCALVEQAVVAFVIERVCDELINGRVAVGIALPALCAAADQLAISLAEIQPSPASKAGLAAAHFELDTLLPIARAAPQSTPNLIGATALLREIRTNVDVSPVAALQHRRAARGMSPPARTRYDLPVT